MAVAAFSQPSFVTNALTSSTLKPRNNKFNSIAVISCRSSTDDHHDPSRKHEMRLAKLAVVALAAGMLTLGAVDEASAAKSGGRVGGQAFRSAPRSSAPRGNNNSRTNIYINPPVAPPLVGGYGYGAPIFGGWGWSPFSFFVPGPSVAVGVGGGFDVLVVFMLLGAVAAVIRRFTGPKDEDDDY